MRTIPIWETSSRCKCYNSSRCLINTNLREATTKFYLLTAREERVLNEICIGMNSDHTWKVVQQFSVQEKE